MGLLVFVCLLFAAWTANQITGNEISNTSRIPKSTIDRLRTRIAAIGGCNANICFAFDATGSVSEEQYRAQKNFAIDFIAVIFTSLELEVAVGQYGSTQPRILPLTSDLDSAVRAINAADRDRSLSSSPLGVAYCISQLALRPGEANKLIVFGDGAGSVGETIVALASGFRALTNGEVCAVGVGTRNDSVLLRIAGGDSSKVFQVDDFRDIFSITDAVIQLVDGVCL